MTPSPFLEAFLKGSPAKNIRMVAARGAVPIPPAEMLRLLAVLARDDDEDVSQQAASTLRSWPIGDILAQLRARECARELISWFAQSDTAQLLEAVVLNPATPADTIQEIAARAPVSVLETILYNRGRLLASPGILRTARSNPAITPELRRLAAEIEQEFFAGKKTEYSIATGAEASAPVQDLPIEPEPPPEDLSLEGLPVDPSAREGFVAERLTRMTVRQKIHTALLGPREARSILIRDTNRQISHAALESPKLTDGEVEAFAAMRNISEDILRELGNRRAWLRNYAVVLNLVKNPKTPPMTSQRLIVRLQNRDLQAIARDRGLSEMVRRNAERTLSQRIDTKKTG